MYIVCATFLSIFWYIYIYTCILHAHVITKKPIAYVLVNKNPNCLDKKKTTKAEKKAIYYIYYKI